jgi:2-hydroxychromene-2-carboxylate isomerase
MGQPTFYYDLNSPYSWLAAERINSVLPEPPVWQPISYSHVIRHTGVPPWSVKPGREKDMQEVERRATERGLPEVRWTEGWPIETVPLVGLRAATFAAEVGKVVSFTLAAFRQFFNAGRPMSELDNVLLAGAACELHPNALKAAVERGSVKEKLKQGTDEAIARGVTGVPTVAVGDELFWGDESLEDAAAALERVSG